MSRDKQRGAGQEWRLERDHGPRSTSHEDMEHGGSMDMDGGNGREWTGKLDARPAWTWEQAQKVGLGKQPTSMR
ncbi:hypothetical protein E4U54_001419 [Claviceps lovelessii]|nr:hypothetical protein E4U54_001419 [Claviceps lovelessii]